MPELIAKSWGAVRHLHATPQVAVDHCEFNRGGQSSWHSHQNKHNAFHVLRGSILVEFRGTEHGPQLVTPGVTLTVMAGVEHRFTAIEDGEMVEVYTPVPVNVLDIDRIVA